MSSLSRTLDRRTLSDVALICAADGLVAVSFGAIAVAGGLPRWVPITLSLVVFAGGAQFAAVGVVLTGGGAVAAVVTGLLLNSRLLPFGFTVADVLTGAWWRRPLGAHLITDESVAFALGQPDQERRRAAFWVCGAALFTSWNIAVVIGSMLGSSLHDTDALGLDAAFPAVLFALVAPALKDRKTRDAALTGAVIALIATPFLPSGLPVLVSLGGLAVAWRPTRPSQATPPSPEVPPSL
jgi:4-azaleucine resistance transporter AzlC